MTCILKNKNSYQFLDLVYVNIHFEFCFFHDVVKYLDLDK